MTAPNLRRRLLPLLVVLGAGAIAVVIVGPGGGDSGDDGSEATSDSTSAQATTSADGAPTGSGDDHFAQIRFAGSSWVVGQGSLLSYPGYLTLANRADEVARLYQEARDAEARRQERLTGLKREAAKEAARHRALAAYREALRKAKLERQRQLERLRAQRERIKRRLAYLREKYKVDPGEECQIPEVREAFDCSTGYPF